MRLDPLVTNVYAEALFETARKRSVALAVTEQAQTIVELLDRERRLRQFLEAPHIPIQAKLNLVENMFRPRFQALLTDFVLYLIRKGRILYLRYILARFQELVQMDQGIFPASIATAKELSFTEKIQLKSSLEKFTGKQLKMVYRVDPRLLGGVVFSAQDTYIDDSLLGHLKRLRTRLQTVEVL